MGLLEGFVGGKVLETLEKALGPDTGPGFLASDPDPFATGVQRGIAQQLAERESAIPSAIDQTGPFGEVSIPYNAIPAPNPSLNQSFNTAPVQVNLAGEELLLKRAGTSPRARFLVDIGGRLHLIQPGTRIEAPFQKFAVVQRSFYISQDVLFNVGNAGSPFIGEAQFIITKTKGAHYVESDAPLVQPFYRPINIIGQMDSNFDNPYVMPTWWLTNSDAPLPLALSGCSRLRIYIANKNYPGAVSATIAAADILTIAFTEHIVGYFPDITAYVQQASNLTIGNSIYNPGNINWVAGTTMINIQLDMSSAPELIDLYIHNSNAHSQYVIVQGYG